jgi:hypothetical protein
MGRGPVDRCRLAAELVRLKVDVVFTYGSATTAAAKQATSVISIVFNWSGRSKLACSSLARRATSPACRISRAI